MGAGWGASTARGTAACSQQPLPHPSSIVGDINTTDSTACPHSIPPDRPLAGQRMQAVRRSTVAVPPAAAPAPAQRGQKKVEKKVEKREKKYEAQREELAEVTSQLAVQAQVGAVQVQESAGQGRGGSQGRHR